MNTPHCSLAACLLATAFKLSSVALAAGPALAEDDFRAMLQNSFHDKGGVTVASILQQDALQEACSNVGGAAPADQAVELQDAEVAQVRYPADGKWLGDWRAGEKIAQNGRGLQFSDNPKDPNGGNCYACHQLNPKDPAFGTLGPSLAGYARTHGTSAEVVKYTWMHLYDAQAVHLCSKMPRFGQQGILSEQQIRDLMALLLDPASPVNQ